MLCSRPMGKCGYLHFLPTWRVKLQLNMWLSWMICVMGRCGDSSSLTACVNKSCMQTPVSAPERFFPCALFIKDTCCDSKAGHFLELKKKKQQMRNSEDFQTTFPHVSSSWSPEQLETISMSCNTSAVKILRPITSVYCVSAAHFLEENNKINHHSYI